MAGWRRPRFGSYWLSYWFLLRDHDCGHVHPGVLLEERGPLRLPTPTRPEPAPLPHLCRTPSRRWRITPLTRLPSPQTPTLSTSSRVATGRVARESHSDRPALEMFAPSWRMTRVRSKTIGWPRRPPLGALQFAPYAVGRERVRARGDRCVGHTSAVGHNLCVVLTSLYLSSCRRVSMTATEWAHSAQPSSSIRRLSQRGDALLASPITMDNVDAKAEVGTEGI